MKASWYSETQRFNQWWIWLALLLPIGIFLWGILKQVVLKQPFGDNPSSDEGLIAGGLIPLLLLLLFRRIRLDTTIDEEGIRVYFAPFSKKFFAWSEIENAWVREYKPLLEYGGWGIRFGAKGTAYNIAGNQGLQLELRNGRRFLIGTQDAAHLQRVLDNHRDHIGLL